MRNFFLLILFALSVAKISAANAIQDDCDWSKFAPSSRRDLVWQQYGPGDGGTTWYLRLHPADAKTALLSCDMSSTYMTHDGNKSHFPVNDPDWGFPRLHYVSGADFCMTQPDVGYAGCETNGVFKTLDRGRSWTRVSTQQLERIFDGKFARVPVSALAVNPADPNEVWIGLGFPRRLESRGKRRLPQGVARSLDGGRTWQHLPEIFPRGEMALAIFMFAGKPGTVIIGTDGGIHRSDDNGKTFRSIAGNLPENAFFGGFDAVIDPHTQEIVTVAALESNYLIGQDNKVKSVGGVWKSSVSQGVWQEVTGNLRIPAELMQSLPENRNNQIWEKAAQRIMWHEFMQQREVQTLYKNVVLNYHKDPGEFHKKWRQYRQNARRTEQLKKILVQNSRDYLMDFHTVKIDPRNTNMFYVSVFNADMPYGLWKTSDNGKNYYCISRGARMWEDPIWQQYVPQGEAKRNLLQAWTEFHPMNYGTEELAAGFWDIRKFDLCKSDPDVLLFHSHRVTYRSSDGGRTFTDISNRITDKQTHRFAGNNNSNMCVFGIEFHPLDPAKVLMYMADCGLKVSRDGGRTMYGLPNVMVGSNQWVLGAAFDPADPEHFYAAFDCKDWLLKGLRGRYLLETKDFGKTFLRTRPGKYAALPPKQQEFNAMISDLKVDPASPRRRRRLIALHSNLDRYAVATGNAAFKAAAPALGIIESTDGGRSFHALNQGFGKNKNAVRLWVSSDFKTMFAAVAMPQKAFDGSGGVYYSKNSGKNWQKLPTPIDNVGDVVYINNKLYIAGGIKSSGRKIVNSGGVYASSDLGKSWQRLLAAPLVSNVAVSPFNDKIIYCTVEKDLNNRMAGFGVYRSSDGGKHWERINKGIAGAYNFTVLKFHPAIPGEVWLGTYGSGFYKLVDSEAKGI